jgi:shikimate kinase
MQQPAADMATAQPPAPAGSIFLVGMMGAGKTSVGRALSRRLGRPFYDSDQVIEERTGVKIPVIFEIEGEAGFRARECAVIEELTSLPDIVLATGGGAVLNERNRMHLRARGTVVYLRASVRDLLNRTRHDRNRPLLQTADGQQKLQELFSDRDPLYHAVADLVVDTGHQSVKNLVRKLEQRLEAFARTGSAALARG